MVTDRFPNDPLLSFGVPMKMEEIYLRSFQFTSVMSDSGIFINLQVIRAKKPAPPLPHKFRKFLGLKTSRQNSFLEGLTYLTKLGLLVSFLPRKIFLPSCYKL